MCYVLVFEGLRFWKRAWRSFGLTSQYQPSLQQITLGMLHFLVFFGLIQSLQWLHKWSLQSRLVALSTTCLPCSELFCTIIKCTKHCPKSGTRQMLLLCLNCSLSTVYLTGIETSFRSQLKHYFCRQVVLTAPTVVLSHLKKLLTVTITSYLAFMLIFF